MHEYFKKLVSEARGERLKSDDPDLFSGAFWAGEGAVARGLADGIADLRGKMRDLFGKEVKLRLVAAKTPWWRPGGGVGSGSAEGFLERFGAGFAGELGTGLIAAAERRSLWSRFGL